MEKEEVRIKRREGRRKGERQCVDNLYVNSESKKPLRMMVTRVGLRCPFSHLF